MPPSLRTLLARPELALALRTPESALPADALDARIAWAHASELVDPTPFLAEGQLLMTTGTQFRPRAPADLEAEFAADYARRLATAGVVALGFGADVVRSTPEALVTACAAHGLPLFEVPYRVPFIAISRTVADLIDEELHARQRWSLAAQRAISLAALRPDGLGATLAELSERLGAWVGLVDASGALDRESPRGGLPEPALGEVLDAARALLRRGRRASAGVDAGGGASGIRTPDNVADGGAAAVPDAAGVDAGAGTSPAPDAAAPAAGPHRVMLQTLGGGGALRGVLAIGDSPELDEAGREVVTSVIALAGLALEQNRDLDRARGHLRAGLLRSILAGDARLAEEVATEMWGGLPAGPVRVAAVDAPAELADRLGEFLELRADERGGRLFFGRRDELVVIILEEGDASVADEVSSEFGVPVGVSDAVPAMDAEALPRAFEHALLALDHARGGDAVVRFDEIGGRGTLDLIGRADAGAWARAALAPLTEHDAARGTALVLTVRTWLEHGGQFDAAARVLGVHRHTVRNRIALVERLLGRDLASFPARAELWTLLLAAG